MEKEEIKAKVLKSFEDSFNANIGEISDTDILREHLDFDSFAFMSLLVSLSRKFSVSFTPADIARMKNIEGIVTLVSEKLNLKAR